MNQYKNIYDFINGEEAAFDRSIEINGWQWNFKNHVKTAFYYNHGRLLNGNDEDTPVKNITRPILNLQKRAEDIDVKDIVLYVDDPQSYHLSFLVKKYHDDVFIVENDIDTFIDELNDSKIVYGGGLAKKGKEARPEVIDLQSIAFCDQTDMMKGPIGFKHFFNPAELKDMEAVGWGSPSNGATSSVQDLIDLATASRTNDKQQGVQNDTPGKYIEIYEVHGVLPQGYLDETENLNEYTRQFQIVGFYRIQDGKRKGVTLFRKELKKPTLKLVQRDKIYSRALGFGGAEELVEPQVWTNYDVIRMKDMLDATSKIVLKAIGSELKSRYPNGLKNIDNLEIIELNQGEDISQIDTTPRSMALFERSVAEWESHAQKIGSATETLLGGDQPASGTPFRSLERQVIEAKGLHAYRRGKYAKFLEEVYRDWIIPHIVEKITEGATFLSELSTEEMSYVVERLVDNKANEFVKEEILSGHVVTKEQVQFFKDKVRGDFIKKGNKHFFKILKGEFKKKPLKVKINVAGKQKDLSVMTDKIVNIFRFIFSNPQGFIQVMQIPGMAENLNSILEYSGLSPIMYAGLKEFQAPQGQVSTVNPQLPSLTGAQPSPNEV